MASNILNQRLIDAFNRLHVGDYLRLYRYCVVWSSHDDTPDIEVIERVMYVKVRDFTFPKERSFFSSAKPGSIKVELPSGEVIDLFGIDHTISTKVQRLIDNSLALDDCDGMVSYRSYRWWSLGSDMIYIKTVMEQDKKQNEIYLRKKQYEEHQKALIEERNKQIELEKEKEREKERQRATLEVENMFRNF